MEAKPTELSSEIQEKIRLLCQRQSSSVSLQDDFGLYIPPSATRAQHSQNTFDLTGAVNDFIEGNKSVLLLFGDSGSGKSFFGQALIKRKSELYQPGDRIPIFIALPSLRKAKLALMDEFMGLSGFTKDEIKILRATQKFFLIFDAYDELNALDNLYMTNNMEDWDAKIMITCRLNYFEDTNYKRYFMPFKAQRAMTAAMDELFVTSFVRGQVSQYIRQYLIVKEKDLRDEIMVRSDLSDEWLVAKTYEAWIEKIPGLKDLSCQPFLLRITMEILPDVIAELQSVSESPEKYHMTSVRLYDHFVKQWYARQENKLIGLGQSVGRAFQKDCMAYARALGKKMHECNLSVVYYEDQSSMTDTYGDEDERGQEMDANVAQWAVFFSDEMLPQDKNSEEKRENRIRSRRACMLKRVGENQWSFMHYSLRDYFMTLTQVGPGKGVASTKSLNNSNNQGQRVASLESVPATRHRIVGKFCLMNRLNKEEADQLLRDESVEVIFENGMQNQKVILGRGAFGKFRIARNLINYRFSGVKKIRGDECIRESEREAEFQRELNGLPNIMPIWDSQIIKSKRTKSDVLLQFMPLAGFGNGEQLVNLLRYVTNEDLKNRFLIHVLKSLLVGAKGMHSRRMFHLDLKPANMVLDCRGEVYIIDFGCAYREYSQTDRVMLKDKKGDFRYFSPERIGELRKHKRPAVQLEGFDYFDAEKSDIWAIGVTLLELLMQRIHYIPGANHGVNWQLKNWDSAHFTRCFEGVPGWADAPENSVLGCVKTLLRMDPQQRLSATAALKNPLFSEIKNQLSSAELRELMETFIRWKTNPPNFSTAMYNSDNSSEDESLPTKGSTASADSTSVGTKYALFGEQQSGTYLIYDDVLEDDSYLKADSHYKVNKNGT